MKINKKVTENRAYVDSTSNQQKNKLNYEMLPSLSKDLIQASNKKFSFVDGECLIQSISPKGLSAVIKYPDVDSFELEKKLGTLDLTTKKIVFLIRRAYMQQDLPSSFVFNITVREFLEEIGENPTEKKIRIYKEKLNKACRTLKTLEIKSSYFEYKNKKKAGEQVEDYFNILTRYIVSSDSRVPLQLIVSPDFVNHLRRYNKFIKYPEGCLTLPDLEFLLIDEFAFRHGVISNQRKGTFATVKLSSLRDSLGDYLPSDDEIKTRKKSFANQIAEPLEEALESLETKGFIQIIDKDADDSLIPCDKDLFNEKTIKIELKDYPFEPKRITRGARKKTK